MVAFFHAVSCLLLLLGAEPVQAAEASPRHQSEDVLAFTSIADDTGEVTVSSKDEVIRVRAENALLESILQEVAESVGTNLVFSCQDPTDREERISAETEGSSLREVLTQLLGDRYVISGLSENGLPKEKAQQPSAAAYPNPSAVHFYPEVRAAPLGCAGVSPPVRTFRPILGHPLLTHASKDVDLDRISRVLAEEGPYSRLTALKMLMRYRQREGAYEVAQAAFKDENPTVMRSAIRALMATSYRQPREQVAEVIRQRIQEKPYLELVLELTKVDGGKAWPFIESLFVSPNQEARRTAVQALGISRDRRGIAPLTRIATDSDPRLASQALSNIGRIAGPEATAALVGLIKRGRADLQPLAAYAISYLPETERAEASKQIEADVKRSDVSSDLLLALAQTSNRLLLDSLMADREVPSPVKIKALQAMQGQGSAELVGTIALGLDSESPQVRFAAVDALVTTATEDAIPHLIRAIQDPNANIRLVGVNALSHFALEGESEALRSVVASLSKTLHDSDPLVRGAAIDQFYVLGRPDEEIKAVLLQAKGHQDPYVAKKAGDILRYWGI